MAIDLIAIRCLSDNYAWLLHGGGENVLIDAPEAAPIHAALKARGWGLDKILLTHHHPDHIQGVEALRSAFAPRIIGNGADSTRLPPLDQAVAPGETLSVCGDTAEVIDVPGHTIGHVAFHLPGAGLAFTGDSLMAMGCGRLFEGTPEMMWDTLSRLNTLPGDTLICSGHDYCAGNGAFALFVDGGNAALKHRLEGTAEGHLPCAPATLEEERATNPFLRAAALRGGLGMDGASELEVFTRLRAMKDAF